MDVDTVLLSVQERDKWRRRLQVLQATLTGIRARRQKAERYLRKLRQELRELSTTSEAILEHAKVGSAGGGYGAQDGTVALR